MLETLNEYTIRDSYATGAVSGNSKVGGLVGGENFFDGTVNNSFWDTQTSGQPTSSGGSGKTTAQMKQQATFTGWNFVNTWGIFENHTYPLLRALPVCIQSGNPPGDANGDYRFDMLDFVILFQYWLEDRNW